MAYETVRPLVERQLADIRARGLYKKERHLGGPQGPAIDVGGRAVINFCANNYLGLATDPRVMGPMTAVLGTGMLLTTYTLTSVTLPVLVTVPV